MSAEYPSFSSHQYEESEVKTEEVTELAQNSIQFTESTERVTEPLM